jgi:transposase InsO family protein
LTVLRQRMGELAQTRVRFGYRRLVVMMHREGWDVGKHHFNGRSRKECLNIHWSASVDDAQEKIDAVRWDCNENDPQRALDGLSPREYAQRVMATAGDSPLVMGQKTRAPH